MTSAPSEPPAAAGYVTIHPWLVRATHWINALAMLVMVMSGWQIYNAAPLFSFRFPAELTLGGWLAGALQWHFAMMWLLAINSFLYLIYGVASGHFRRDLSPITHSQLRDDLKRAFTFKLQHRPGVYNAIQRAAYAGVIVVILLLIVSGLALWKPMQLQELAWILGGYEGARLVHFFAMGLLVAFVTVHVLMVLIVPKSLISMITGKAKLPAPVPQSNYVNFPNTESGDAL